MVSSITLPITKNLVVKVSIFHKKIEILQQNSNILKNIVLKQAFILKFKIKTIAFESNFAFILTH